MALNRVREEADALSLPVPDGTVSGDPLVLGALPCVATTDKGAWTAGEASVDCDGSYLFDVKGDVDGTPTAIAVGDIVYLAADGVISVDADEKRFGYALQAVQSGATTEIEVKVGY